MGIFTETDVGDIIVVNETNSTLIITTKEKLSTYKNRIVEACKEASKLAIDAKCIGMSNCRCVICTIDKVRYNDKC